MPQSYVLCVLSPQPLGLPKQEPSAFRCTLSHLEEKKKARECLQQPTVERLLSVCDFRLASWERHSLSSLCFNQHTTSHVHART